MSGGVYNKFSGYHNRRSIRLKNHDYSRPGYYFITICCAKSQQHLFGNVVNGQMVLNEAGKFTRQCWSAIPDHFPRVTLDAFVVMPNHVHGILKLRTISTDANHQLSDDMDNDVQCDPGKGRNTNTTGNVVFVGVQNIEPLQGNGEPLQNRPESLQKQPDSTMRHVNQYQHIIPQSVGSIIRGFKIGVTKWFRERSPNISIWQRSFFDHIIRDEKSLYFIRRYIRNNPLAWDKEKENHLDNEIAQMYPESAACREQPHCKQLL
jgi:putative transposase